MKNISNIFKRKKNLSIKELEEVDESISYGMEAFNEICQPLVGIFAVIAIMLKLKILKFVIIGIIIAIIVIELYMFIIQIVAMNERIRREGIPSNK